MLANGFAPGAEVWGAALSGVCKPLARLASGHCRSRVGCGPSAIGTCRTRCFLRVCVDLALCAPGAFTASCPALSGAASQSLGGDCRLKQWHGPTPDQSSRRWRCTLAVGNGFRARASASVVMPRMPQRRPARECRRSGMEFLLRGTPDDKTATEPSRLVQTRPVPPLYVDPVTALPRLPFAPMGARGVACFMRAGWGGRRGRRLCASRQGTGPLVCPQRRSGLLQLVPEAGHSHRR